MLMDGGGQLQYRRGVGAQVKVFAWYLLAGWLAWLRAWLPACLVACLIVGGVACWFAPLLVSFFGLVRTVQESKFRTLDGDSLWRQRRQQGQRLHVLILLFP